MPLDAALLDLLGDDKARELVRLRQIVEEGLAHGIQPVTSASIPLPRGRYDTLLIQTLARSLALDGWRVHITEDDGKPILTLTKP